MKKLRVYMTETYQSLVSRHYSPVTANWNHARKLPKGLQVQVTLPYVVYGYKDAPLTAGDGKEVTGKAGTLLYALHPEQGRVAVALLHGGKVYRNPKVPAHLVHFIVHEYLRRVSRPEPIIYEGAHLDKIGADVEYVFASLVEEDEDEIRYLEERSLNRIHQALKLKKIGNIGVDGWAEIGEVRPEPVPFNQPGRLLDRIYFILNTAIETVGRPVDLAGDKKLDEYPYPLGAHIHFSIKDLSRKFALVQALERVVSIVLDAMEMVGEPFFSQTIREKDGYFKPSRRFDDHVRLKYHGAELRVFSSATLLTVPGNAVRILRKIVHYVKHLARDGYVEVPDHEIKELGELMYANERSADSPVYRFEYITPFYREGRWQKRG